ncbi:lipocalin family protein [Sphingobacterium thalpophilum]|uniref:Lipocalin family protein n=1 Tax=Sphingobacterium thalpophilum TaxID=259 RepID=A0ABV4H8B5_9SPHI|nr:lipocalin family protein [Sphingobacterium thalpophilum]
MKQRISAFLTAICLLLMIATGCSKDNDLPDQPDQDIVGKWQLEKYVTQQTPGETDTYIGKDGEWAEFKKDGTGTQRWDEGGGKFDLEPFTWKISGSKLTITDDLDDEEGADQEEFTIVKLTKQELVFKGEWVSDDGNGKDIKITETYYLRR